MLKGSEVDSELEQEEIRVKKQKIECKISFHYYGAHDAEEELWDLQHARCKHPSVIPDRWNDLRWAVCEDCGVYLDERYSNGD